MTEDDWFENRSDLPLPPNVPMLNRRQIIDFTGCSPRLIDKHISEGMPCVRGAGKGSPLAFNPAAVVQYLIRHAANDGKAGSLADIKKKTSALNLEKRQVEFQAMRGNLVSVATVVKTVDESVSALRERFLSVPDRVEASAKIKASIKAEIIDAINDLSLDEWNDHE